MAAAARVKAPEQIEVRFDHLSSFVVKLNEDAVPDLLVSLSASVGHAVALNAILAAVEEGK